ncbi:T9SS type A sorting domain-containing protein [Membranicola marinus]|uniref:Aminopeptidase N n=1 Tax=Membranihabitans marinus TaxID=1227546 RepID=A0A953HMW5_9BACT|nr:M1 family aminopeptidase [Membranihabitans marinus]MBY5958914.1 T9SS type A sorting domain-containing protein [Membranihabitans marinus]
MKLLLFKILTCLLFALGNVTTSQANSVPIHRNDSASDQIKRQGIIDITHQELHLSVDPAKRYIKGRVRTTFHAMEEPVSSIHIDLHDDLSIDSIVSRTGKSLSFIRQENLTTSIALADTLTSHHSTSITIYYQGVPPEDGFGAFVQSTHNNTPIIWTLSEPYGARNWWPCAQNLEDKIDSLDMWVTVPVGNRVAGNGLLISEKKIGQDQTVFHWKHRYPIATYLVAFAVTNYQVHEFTIPLKNGALPILNYLYPEDYDRHSQNIEEILPAMMHLFEELFIPYPFDREKYGHAQFGFGGGMEHQTMSFMVNFSYSLTAHELAHQWFGDYVTCGSWKDIWLNEGFAGYLTGLAYERILQNGTWENYLASSIRSITSQPGGTLLVSDTSTVGRIFNSRLSYQKGAMVLHMLRWILGDDDFFEGVRQYLLDEDTQYAFARTTHLKHHLEKVAGINLDEFFNDWYTGQGYPSYQVQWQRTDVGIKLHVNQISSHPSVPFFELPVEFGIYGPERDTMIRLDIRENSTEYRIEIPWHVDSIAVDPQHWLVSANNTTEFLTSTDTSPLESEYRIYPNPSPGKITIEGSGLGSIKKIFLYTSTGKPLTSFTPRFKNENSMQLQVVDQPPGLYFIVIHNDREESTVHKFILN